MVIAVVIVIVITTVIIFSFQFLFLFFLPPIPPIGPHSKKILPWEPRATTVYDKKIFHAPTSSVTPTTNETLHLTSTTTTPFAPASDTTTAVTMYTVADIAANHCTRQQLQPNPLIVNDQCNYHNQHSLPRSLTTAVPADTYTETDTAAVGHCRYSNLLPQLQESRPLRTPTGFQPPGSYPPLPAAFGSALVDSV